MINAFLPDAWVLRCRHIKVEPEIVTAIVETVAPMAVCPLCGGSSGHVHSRYTRTLGDLPWQGRVVRWRLLARKFFCDRESCRRKIFAERLPKIVACRAHKTLRLNAALTRIGFANRGEGGVRLTGFLGMPTSPDTLLRRIPRASPGPGSTLRTQGKSRRR